MNIFITTILCILIIDIYANFNVTSRHPHGTMFISEHEFKITIDHDVNQPEFPSFIRIYENNSTIHEINTITKSSNITYADKTLTFHTPDNFTGKINTEYHIQLDAGVLFSGNISNSTAKTGSEFWGWKYIDNENSLTTTVSSSTTSNNSNPTNTTISQSTLSGLPTGEPPPTRSAQLGMGLGIILIGIILIIEILYFKRFYHGHLRNDSYIA